MLLLWNRSRHALLHARAYEAAGATVIVAENGYIAPRRGDKLYALALGHHNGAGRWPVGGPERWASLEVELHPWRSAGEHILLLPQRGIGAPGVAMPHGWPNEAMTQLRARTKRLVKIRRHPGHAKSEPYEDLRGAHAAVTWGSGAGIKALAAGIPVFHAFPRWIGASSALSLDGADLEAPLMRDDLRLAMFERLAWAQWGMADIVSGEAFRWLLGM